MSAPLSDRRLEKIREYWEASTGGEWVGKEDGSIDSVAAGSPQNEQRWRLSAVADYVVRTGDRLFITYAHKTVPLLLAEIDRLREVEAEYNADHDSYVETVRLWGRTVKQAHELGADVIAPFQAIRWMVAEINRLRAENEQLRSAWRKPIEYTSGETVPYKGPPIQSYTASEAAEFAGWERLSDEALANFEVQA